MRYREFELGPALAGARGAVFLGHDESRGLPVALRRFERGDPPLAPEALPPLPFPGTPQRNLARTLAIHVHDGEVVVVSELALGPTLDALVAGRGQPPAVVAGLVAKALEGLVALHREGRAHGRLHPGNLILDVDQGCLRLVDLCAVLFRGVPSGRDPRKGYARPGLEVPSPQGDVYAVGRIAEALLRGGEPLGAWSPIGAFGDADRPRARLGEWIERCQSLDPGEGFSDAAAALDAIRLLGEGAQQAVAQVRAGSWALARRRALRAIARSREGLPGARPSVQLLSQALSSQRATFLWQRVAFGACAAVALSGWLARRPRAAEAGAEAAGSPAAWSDGACVEAARPQPVGKAGLGTVELTGAARLAIDGCPVPLSGAGAKLALSPGTHQLRALVAEAVAHPGPPSAPGTASPGRVVDTSFAVGAGSQRLALDGLPVATKTDAAGAEEVARELASLESTPAPVPPSSGDPIGSAALDAVAARALAVARSAGRPEIADSLPDDLALDLDALRAAGDRLEVVGGGWDAKLDRAARDAMREDGSTIEPKLLEATRLVGAVRIFANEGGGDLERERAVLSRLGQWDGPRLDRAVAQTLSRPELAACRKSLEPAAEDVAELSRRAILDAREAADQWVASGAATSGSR